MADYWALGILIHEMRVGKTPFSDPSQSQAARKIVVNEPDFSKAIDEITLVSVPRINIWLSFEVFCVS